MGNIVLFTSRSLDTGNSRRYRASNKMSFQGLKGQKKRGKHVIC